MKVDERMSESESRAPLQVLAELVESVPVGAYQRLTFDAPEVAQRVRPGQFVTLAVGGEQSAMLLRRSFSVHRAAGGRLVVVVAGHGPGTRWLVARRPGDVLDLVGPLGQPFAVEAPARSGGDGPTAVLVGGGYGSAPLVPLAELLGGQGWAVHAVVGAASSSLLFGVQHLESAGARVSVTTDDGSAGTPGRVTEVLPGLLTTTGATAVYACGPMAMLAAVQWVAAAATGDVRVQCAVEEAMACGIGICMTCVLPVIGHDGRTRMVRSCTEGPVFDGARVRWDDVGTVPADCVGALRTGGH